MYEDLICEKDAQIEYMKGDLIDAEKKKREEEEQFKMQLLDEAARRQQRDWYVPTIGDPVDEMFAAAVNACPYSVPVIKHGDGQYTFGTKKVNAKIMSEKLVIRVSGGYMLVDEFLRTYAESESKLQDKMQTPSAAKTTGRVSPGKGRTSQVRTGSPGSLK